MIAIDKFCRVITSFSLGLLPFVALLLLPAGIQARSVALPPAHWNALSGGWALADLDGDRQPDIAVAEPPGRSGMYRISLRLSGADAASQFDVPAIERGGLTISARDVDGDHDLDLVITSGIGRHPVGIWLNDGAGNFTQADSSLYPAWIWRGAPALFSLPSATGLYDAGLERSRWTSVAADSFAVAFRAAESRLPLPSCDPAAVFFPGAWRVRPPPIA